MRWIGSTVPGRRGELLYPSGRNPEASFEIDNMTEISDGFLGKFGAVYRNPPVSDEKAQEVAETIFRDLLFKIDLQLKFNSSPNFLVGNSMTTADISMGAYVLKYAIADTHPHQLIYAKEMRNFPRVNNWAQNTIAPTFRNWFANQPKGMLNGA